MKEIMELLGKSSWVHNQRCRIKKKNVTQIRFYSNTIDNSKTFKKIREEEGIVYSNHHYH